MYHHRLFLIFLYLYASVLPGCADIPAHWRYWLAGDGLGESCSHSVFTGPSGIVWVNHGDVSKMSRLDGYSVRNIPSPGVGVPVYENPEGQLWSIYKNGFQKFRYDNDFFKGKWYPYPVEGMVIETLPFFPVAEDLLLYMTPVRLMAFDARTNQQYEIKNVAQTGLSAFYSLRWDGRNGIWVAGKSGLAHASRIEDTTVPAFSWQESMYPDRNEYDSVKTLRGVENQLWITAHSENQSQLFSYNGIQWKSEYTDKPYSFEQGWKALDGLSWFYHEPFSLQVSDGRTTSVIANNKILSRILLDVDIEKDGAFWLATSEGLAHCAPATWSIPAAATGYPSVVHSILEDAQGRPWFTYTDFLACYCKNQWNFFPFPKGQRSDELKAESLCALADNRLLIKTQRDLLIFSVESKTFEIVQHRFNFEIVLIASKEDGTVWVLTYDTEGMNLCIEIYDGKEFRIQYIQTVIRPYISSLRHVLQDKGGFMLCGLNGLVRFEDDQVKIYGTEDGLTESALNCFHRLKDGRIWAGGRDSIHEFQNGRWTRIRSGFDGVRAIQSGNDGSIWVASGTGLHRYKDGSWVTNTFEDGLPNAAVYDVFQDSSNRLWAGTTGGLCLYDPSADQDAPETIVPEDKNSREHAPNGSQFYFEGMDQWKYTQSDRLLFSYRIDEGAWSPFQSEHVASLPRIPAGNHVFAVRAMDRNWNIDPTPARYGFVVLLPWYQQPALLLIIGFGVLLLLSSLALHFSHHRNLGKLVLERTADLTFANEQLQNDAKEIRDAYNKVMEYQKELQSLAMELASVEEDERRHIASDLHDSIGQLLSLMMIKLEMLDDSLADHPETGEVKKIKSLVEQALLTCRNLTYELCPPILYELGFEAALNQLIEQFRERYNLQVYAEIDPEPKPLNENLRYFLFRATRELLMNVVKHAKIQEAHLGFFRKNRTIEICIEDFGAGFTPAQTARVVNHKTPFGLFSIRERLKRIGGELRLESKPGKGTRITLAVPIETEV